MTPQQLADALTECLRKAGPGSRQGHRPSQESDFGVYAKDLRAIEKQFKPDFVALTPQEAFECAQALIAKRVYECRIVAYELLGMHPAACATFTLRQVEALGRGMDNWAVVDVFSLVIAGPAWRMGNISDRALLRWAASIDRWWRRAALVATVALNVKARGGLGDAARTLLIASKLAGDKDDMVYKALSWAMRELIKHDRKAVENFLETHPEMAAQARREISKKLTTGKK